MKFGKLLEQKKEKEFGQGRINAGFLRFKLLKKQLKAAEHPPVAEREQPGHGLEDHAAGALEATAAGSWGTDSRDRGFVQILREDLHSFNHFFIDKEEDLIIQLQALEAQLKGARDASERARLRTALVDLHGEMVLLLDWSTLNFAAITKILKKHDKVLGAELRGPVLAKVLQQPFYSTGRVSELVQRAEACIEALFAEKQGASPGTPGDEAERPETCEAQGVLARRTEAALALWSELGANAATPSTVVKVKRARDEEGEEASPVGVPAGGADEGPAVAAPPASKKRAAPLPPAEARPSGAGTAAREEAQPQEEPVTASESGMAGSGEPGQPDSRPPPPPQ